VTLRRSDAGGSQGREHRNMDDGAVNGEGKGPNGKKLLLVLADKATRIAFTHFVGGRRYAVVTAENSQEALAYLRQNTPPSIILLDRIMPVRNNYEFRRALRTDPALASIPIIVLSAVCEEVPQADPFGDVGCIQKPLDANVLLAAIQRFTVPSKPEILVVENEAAIRRLLDVVLRHYGFGVRLAASGQEAVKLYQRDHEAVTIVLLDVQMPGLDGPGTLAALKRINPEVRCCFMSGHTGKYTSEELLALGAAHVIMKPFVSLGHVACLLWNMVGDQS
jgi:two-component system OmpR family response regulator